MEDRSERDRVRQTQLDAANEQARQAREAIERVRRLCQEQTHAGLTIVYVARVLAVLDGQGT